MKLLISLLTILFISANYPQDVKHKESDLLIYAQQKMNIDDYVSTMRAIEIGEKYFDVDRDIVLAVIFIEYDFKVNAVNRKTKDYGLSQQNDKYYLARYKHVSRILDAEKISYDINNKYNIYLNVLSCFYYLDHCMNLKGSKSQGVKKYNGAGKRADAYLNKFLRVYYG
ncbi:MAG TPA: hypothetical protein PLA54_11775 [Spirochaetota bacterium]|nr:hypothetical protein [Spirochaetota bacterium]